MDRDDLVEEYLASDSTGKDKLLKSLIGFRDKVPTIDEFLDDTYYLGDTSLGKNIYPHWRKCLREIYPSPYRTKPTVVLKGCIGGGKTFVSIVILLYDLAKFLLVDNPQEFFGIAFDKGISLSCVNITKEKVLGTIFHPLCGYIWGNQVPFFTDILKETSTSIRVEPAKSTRDIISLDVLSVHLCELNKIKPYEAFQIISECYARLNSRFQAGIGFFNHVIIDSSDTTDTSNVEEFLRNNPYGSKNMCNVFCDPIWVIKSHLGLYFNEGSYFVFTGSNSVRPFILTESPNSPKYQELDPQKIIECPSETRMEADADIEKFLKDTCGVGITSGSLWFNDLIRYHNMFSLDQVVPEIIIVDFYNEETIMEQVFDAITEAIPEDRKITARLDLGISGDLSGIAIGYQEEWRSVKVDNRAYNVGFLCVPIVFALSRNPGQETPIGKIRDFFLGLTQVREIQSLTTDQYQSVQIIQECRRVGIPSWIHSVDRNDYSYSIAKRYCLEERVKLPSNKRLIDEGLELYWNGRKVDHPNGGSKDLWDAVAGVISVLHDKGSEASDESSLTRKRMTLKDYNRLLEMIEAPKTGTNILWR